MRRRWFKWQRSWPRMLGCLAPLTYQECCCVKADYIRTCSAPTAAQRYVLLYQVRSLNTHDVLTPVFSWTFRRPTRSRCRPPTDGLPAT
jgi:hypothetical protein